LSYLKDNFYTDTWLTADESGAARIVNVTTAGGSDSVPAEQQLIGAILVRKVASAP